jgi:hypothetical protein
LGLGTYCTRVVFIWWCVLAMKNIFVARREESFETYGQTSAKQKSKLVSTAIFWRFLVVEGGGFDVLF